MLELFFFTYFLYHASVSNPDDDKFPHFRKCAGVDCCLPLDTKSNGDPHSMFTWFHVCLHDKTVSYIQSLYTFKCKYDIV